jgi:hypothetical protein
MEKDVNLGTVGTAQIKLAGGVASASESASYTKSFLNGLINLSVTEQTSVNADLVGALELIKAAVEAALPAGKTIEDFAFAEIETVLKGIV